MNEFDEIEVGDVVRVKSGVYARLEGEVTNVGLHHAEVRVDGQALGFWLDNLEIIAKEIKDEAEPRGGVPATLRRVADIVEERGKRRDNDRGFPAFEKTAELWSAYGVELTAKDVAIMMALHKVAREVVGEDPDNVDDAIGYLAISKEL